MNALIRWLDSRTGVVSAFEAYWTRRIPGGPGWRYVLPSALLFGFLVQAISGLFMWMAYSANAQGAWESVFWLQECTRGGWLLRGIHVFTGHAIVAMAGLYAIQLILSGMYRAPREFIFWIAMAMLFCSLGLMLTGDLLRWDQVGYWSTQVRTRFLMLIPIIGGDLFQAVVGGSDFGHLTLTRFIALHAGVCAVGFGVLVCCNLALLRRHGLSNAPAVDSPEQQYGSGQWCRNFCGWVVLSAIVLALVFQNYWGEHPGQLRGEYLGAHLGAPANPAEAYSAARPEWAFLALYQFANIFPGEGIAGTSVSWKVVPIFVIPSTLVCLFFLMPFLARLRGGHVFNVCVTLAMLVACGALSWACVAHDRDNEIFQRDVAAGHLEELRAKELAHSPQGIPPGGAISMLRNDAKIQGPKLFAQHCASCHPCVGPDGKGIPCQKPSAPNLFGFGTRKWVAGWLDAKQIAGPDYFGKTKFADGQMVGHMRDAVKELLKDKDIADDVKKQLAMIPIALSAEAGLKSQKEADAADKAKIAEGREALGEDVDCLSCHKFQGKGKTTGCDLTGYASRDWTIGIISNPADKRFYGQPKEASGNDRMPAYAESPNEPAKNLLSQREIEMLADWLRGEWYEHK